MATDGTRLLPERRVSSGKITPFARSADLKQPDGTPTDLDAAPGASPTLTKAGKRQTKVIRLPSAAIRLYGLAAFALMVGLLGEQGGGMAADAKSGREKARMCAICHGELGIAVVPNAPNLAGENAAYVASQLKAYRSGKRRHEQMSIIASGLDDEDIADLAAWFAAIKVTVEEPKL